ncbi:MAG: DUF1573 domain-containing protein [Bacteroidota bacterium]
MRTLLRFIIALLILTAGLSSALAQDSAGTKEQDATSELPTSPQLAANDSSATRCFTLTEPTEYYFGEIRQSDTVVHTFVFRNECADTIEIGSARSSCGCTSIVLSDKVIPPGGEARILAKFTPPRGSKGRVSKSVSVYLKGASSAHTVLRVSATVHCAIEIEPSYIQIPNAVAGVPSSVQSRITNVSDSTILIETTGISLTSYPDDAEKAGGETLPLDGGTVTPASLALKPGESALLTIGVTPRYKGQLNGSVGLKIGDSENVIFLFAEVGEK